MKTEAVTALARLLSLTFAAAGCDDSNSAPEVQVTVAPAEVCADGPTVFGIDVSKWQSVIDWRRVAGDGVKYAFIRISDGPNVLDSKFVPNWAGALENGILRGSYQFFRQDEDPVVQADIVIDYHLRYGVGELPPVIDVESTDGQDSRTMVSNIRAWIDRIEGALGVTPIIYTGRYFWNGSVDSTEFSDYPLWHAQYTGARCPNIAAAWSRWTFWQYSSTGRVDGIDGNVDMNRFNGSEAALRALSGDPRCQETPDVAVCEGDGIGTCDGGGRFAVSPCPAGSRCVDGPLCVDARCEAAGGPDADFCLDAGTRAACTEGVLARERCAPGSVCVEGGPDAPPSCVDARCLEQGLESAFCLDPETIGRCSSGALTTARCPATAACEAGVCVEGRGTVAGSARRDLRGSVAVVGRAGCGAGGDAGLSWLALAAASLAWLAHRRRLRRS